MWSKFNIILDSSNDGLTKEGMKFGQINIYCLNDYSPIERIKKLENYAIRANLGEGILVYAFCPYVFSHLNNLVGNYTNNKRERKKLAEFLYLKDPNALLNIDDVAAYEIREGEYCSLKDPVYGIRWDTLSDLSVELQEIYFKMADIRDGS